MEGAWKDTKGPSHLCIPSRGWPCGQMGRSPACDHHQGSFNGMLCHFHSRDDQTGKDEREIHSTLRCSVYPEEGFLPRGGLLAEGTIFATLLMDNVFNTLAHEEISTPSAPGLRFFI